MNLPKILPRSESLANRAPAKNGQVVLMLFGLISFVVTSVLAVAILVVPLIRVLNAQGWVKTPCTIIESRMGEKESRERRSSRHGSGEVRRWSYRVEVRFAYHFPPGNLENGSPARRYESTRYDFADWIWTNRKDAKVVEAARLAPGTLTTCHVNPNQPAEAVLHSGLPNLSYFGFIPLIFSLASFALIIAGFRRMHRQRQEIAQSITDEDQTSPRELLPAQRRVSTLITIGLLALCWNSLSGAVLMAYLLEPSKGELPVYAVLFVLGSLIVGLVLVGAFFHSLLALSNPRVRLLVSRTARLGEAFDLEWECIGNPSRMTLLRLTLEGRESATYTRSTSRGIGEDRVRKTTITETHVFARTELATIEDPTEMLSGKTRVVLPLTTVPTFIASYNKLEWVLCVRGTIPRWPDLSDDYPITVLPRKTP